MTAPYGPHARRLEEQTRALLAEAAGLVVPGDGLPAIRARTARPRWRRAWDRVAAWALAPRHVHAHTFRPDWLDTTDVRCWCGARPASRTAAPADTGTAAKAVIYRKDTAMSHDLIEEGTPRGRQIAAALALAHLLEADPLADMAVAPVPNWKVDAVGRLHGHVHAPWSDDRARAALDAYAGFLGTQVKRSQGRNEHSEWVHLSASATYRDVPVNVWTRVDIRAISPYASFGDTSMPSVYEDMGVRDAIRAEIARQQGGGRSDG